MFAGNVPVVILLIIDFVGMQFTLNRWMPDSADERILVRSDSNIPQEDIDDLESRTKWPEYRDIMTLESAIHRLESRADPRSHLTELRRVAIRNLRTLVPYFGDPVEDKSMVFKIFNDLDLVFFDGTLRNNICLQVKRFDPKYPADTWTRGFHSLRVCIRLNVFYLDGKLRPRRKLSIVIRSMLHEMCHAYLFVHCGPDAEEQYVKRSEKLYDKKHGSKAGHGIHFPRCSREVQRRLDTCKWNIDMTNGGVYAW